MSGLRIGVSSENKEYSVDKRGFMREFTSSIIKLYGPEGEIVYKGKVRDVSAGGVLVLSGGLDDLAEFQESQEINFKLSLPTGLVAGIAEIMYVDNDEGRMGLKFVKIVNRDGAANLMSFVANGLSGA